jgi:DNA-binding LacI/PurR family transcriptional regulator/signal transduction histidine kinase
VIGLLVSNLYDAYEESIWKSVSVAAEEQDVDALFFLLGATVRDETADDLFDLVQPDCVDGLIAVSTSLFFATSPGLAERRLASLARLPVVSFSERVGQVRLRIDNASGIARHVEHLARDHGRRRIAFLSGPPRLGDAAERLQGYREGLARVGLPFDPQLVLEADFTRRSTRDAFHRLDRAPVEFEALVAANDAMALAAMDELRRRGRQVPQDVAVCGFDDIPDAASTDLPLTTLRQPLEEMGREAVRQVLALIRGEAVPSEIVFPTQLVIRRTCGCSHLPVSRGPPVPVTGPGPLAEALERELPELGPRIGASSWAAPLAGGLYAAVGAGDARPWIAALEQLLRTGLARVPEPEVWLRVLWLLVTWARGDLPAEQRARLADLHAEANALVAAMAVRTQVARRILREEEDRVFRWLVQPFPHDEDTFLENLVHQLQLLGVGSFFFSRFLDAGHEQAALVAHFDADGIAELEEPPAPFAPRRLIPGRFGDRRRRSHAVLPVAAPDGLVGFALCELGSLSDIAYEIITHEMSTVLSVNGLVAAVREQQRQLLETARQAGMAEVAVGALHNVGNLLNSVSVSAEEIGEAAQAVPAEGILRAAALMAEHAADLPGFFTRDPRAEHLPAYLARAAQAVEQELARIQAESRELVQRTGLVRDSIRTLQDHARGSRELAERETIELETVVGAALEIQRGNLDRHRVVVRRELDGIPPFTAPRAKLVHVLVNLVKNGIESMRASPEGKRQLTVRAAREADGRIRLEVRDTGEGISAENLERIFAYGFTTKPDGHGFGLHTCATYMKQMGGSLSVASDGVGQGACFALLLPA